MCQLFIKLAAGLPSYNSDFRAPPRLILLLWGLSLYPLNLPLDYSYYILLDLPLDYSYSYKDYLYILLNLLLDYSYSYEDYLLYISYWLLNLTLDYSYSYEDYLDISY